MKKICVGLVLSVVLFSCKKDNVVSVECYNPSIQLKFDSCRTFITNGIDFRLSNFQLNGNIASTDTSCSRIINEVDSLITPTATCYQKLTDYKYAVLAMYHGSNDVTPDFDSLELVDFKRRCDLKWQEIESYLKNL